MNVKLTSEAIPSGSHLVKNQYNLDPKYSSSSLLKEVKASTVVLTLQQKRIKDCEVL